MWLSFQRPLFYKLDRMCTPDCFQFTQNTTVSSKHSVPDVAKVKLNDMFNMSRFLLIGF